MNILLVTPLAYGTSDIPLMLTKAFEKDDHKVIIFPTDEQLSPKENAIIRSSDRWTKEFIYTYSKRILNRTKETKPDLLFIYGSNWAILPETLQNIKLSTDTTIILWEGNFQILRGYQIESLRIYDYIFLMDSYLVPLLKGPAGLKDVYYLAQGCDPEIHRPINLSDEEFIKYSSDVCYLGRGYPNRIKLFEGLLNYDIRLWGLGWGESDLLRKFYINETVYGLKKSKIYNASKITLNLQGTHIQINGISNRPFEVLACGGFCISEEKPDLLLHLKPGEEIVTYKNIPDLHQKIEYYLKHEDERREIAANGRKKVLANRTYQHITKEIIDTISR